MKITLLAIGKRMPNWVNAGFQEYSQRLSGKNALSVQEIAMPTRNGQTSVEKLIQQEGKQLLAASDPKAVIVALDSRGELWDTKRLAQKLQKWQETTQTLNLLIGGPDGLSAECLARANCQWSLSPLTFPHGLVRVIVAEQLYRALSILQGHPYHRE
jgi:23S rRNA (pseudouridine1915-N3)-methyltransferase